MSSKLKQDKGQMLTDGTGSRAEGYLETFTISQGRRIVENHQSSTYALPLFFPATIRRGGTRKERQDSPNQLEGSF